MHPRIGFLGGTFDPPHNGHLRLARHAALRLGLDHVLLAPVGIQPLKRDDLPRASWPQRLRMVQLATQATDPAAIDPAARPGHSPANATCLASDCVASDIDAPRPDGRPNYSAETLLRLREANPEAEIFFLLGADAFRSLRQWHQPDLLLQQCELVVATRPGQQLPQDGNDLLDFLPIGTRFLGTEEVNLRQQKPAGREHSAGSGSVGTGPDKPGPDKASPDKASPDKASPDKPGPDSESPITARVFLAGSALVRLYLLSDLAEDIAATDLRTQLAAGQGYEQLPGGEQGPLANYLREQHLYQL